MDIYASTPPPFPGSLFMTGDLIAQHLIERTEKWDKMRTLRLATYGGCFAGPAISMWYRFLNRTIQFDRKWKNMVARVVVDQSLFAPTFLGMFLTVNGVMEGLNGEQIQEKLNQVTIYSSLLHS